MNTWVNEIPISCLAAEGIHLIAGSSSWHLLGLGTYILYFRPDMKGIVYHAATPREEKKEKRVGEFCI